MTPEKRAEKVINAIYPFDVQPPEWKQTIAAEIREAAEEAYYKGVNKAFAEGYTDGKKVGYQECLEKAFKLPLAAAQAAYEDAARICEESVKKWEGDGTQLNICAMDPLELAASIRAKAKELK